MRPVLMRPVLMRPILAGAPRVFDLGGNVGNLSYCYSKDLDILPGLVWQVHDPRETGQPRCDQWEHKQGGVIPYRAPGFAISEAKAR